MLANKRLLNDFFDASNMGIPDTRYRKDFQEWGQESIISGVEVIRDRIQNIGSACADVMELGPDFDLPLGSTKPGCMQAFEFGWHMESAFSWVLEEVGIKTSDNTLCRLLSYPDYDVSIIAAKLLNWNKRDKARISKPLLDSFQSRAGTAFRLAAAITLYAQNEIESLEQVAVPFLIPSLSSLKELSELEKKKEKEEFMSGNPDSEQMKKYMLDNIGTPLTRFLSRVEKIIFWDIATRGKGPKKQWSSWWIRE